MRELTDMSQQERGYCLSKRHDYWLSLDGNQVQVKDQVYAVQCWQSGDDISALQQIPTRVGPRTAMHDVMEIRYHTGHSVLVGDDQAVQGVVGDRELYHTLLGKMMSDD